MKNSIGSKQALAEAQKKAEALTSLGIAVYSHHQQHPPKPLPALLRPPGKGVWFLWYLCQEQGQSGPESLVQSSVKAVEDYSVLVSGFGISCLYNSLRSNEV